MSGKLAVVTGASSGIGAATAKLLAQNGATAVLLARDAERLARIASEIGRDGGNATCYAVDLGDDSATADAGARIAAEHGTPDILVNNAGAGAWKPIAETAPQEARAMMDVPYFAAFTLTRAFLPGMMARGSGRIACVTSPASYIAWPNAAGYVAARQALKGLTDTLRLEARGSGVSVTLAVLGLVETPYWRNNPGARQHVPTSRLLPVLTPTDAAEAIVRGLEGGKRTIFRPALLRAAVLLHALAPRAVERRILRAAKTAKKASRPD